MFIGRGQLIADQFFLRDVMWKLGISYFSLPNTYIYKATAWLRQKKGTQTQVFELQEIKMDFSKNLNISPNPGPLVGTKSIRLGWMLFEACGRDTNNQGADLVPTSNKVLMME
jgi:hypothetical protein